jgi:hypothetical protein
MACGRDAGDTESRVRCCGIAGGVHASIIAARSTNCSVLTREVVMDGCFSQDYVEAREKCAAAARAVFFLRNADAGGLRRTNQHRHSPRVRPGLRDPG